MDTGTYQMDRATDPANHDYSHPVIHDALAYWRGLAPLPGRTSRLLRTETAAFVSHVIGLAGAGQRSDGEVRTGRN